jgi:hypothetical protein
MRQSMSNWNIVRQKVSNVKTPEDKNNMWKWISQSRALQRIIDVAEVWEIPSGTAEEANISNLSEIIVEANKAIVANDKERLNGLFKCANEYSNKKLRYYLRGEKLPEIKVKVQKGPKGSCYLLKLTKEQYDRLEGASRYRFRFSVEDK